MGKTWEIYGKTVGKWEIWGKLWKTAGKQLEHGETFQRFHVIPRFFAGCTVIFQFSRETWLMVKTISGICSNNNDQ
jgi:hypothetical protein